MSGWRRVTSRSTGPAEASGSQFEAALSGMFRLFSDVGEERWAKSIGRDLKRWQETRDVEGHLSSHGAMGSLTDVILCRQNGHDLSPEQEPWADTLYQLLLVVLHALASNGGRDLPAERLSGSFDPRTTQLQGRHCRACGYLETQASALEYLLAQRHLRRTIIDALLQDRLQDYVADILALRIASAEADRKHLVGLCEAAGVPIVTDPAWMRTCPKCRSDQTAMYRWEVNGKLEPAPDNLPLID